jgi:putative nucleotidyltransferase with HDIG domain
MKHPSENDINLFSSALLGALSVCLLLTPAHSRIVRTDDLDWFFVILGLSAFTTALSLQIVSILHARQSTGRVIQVVSAILLFIFTVLFAQAGYMLESVIIFFAGLMQLILVLSLGRHFHQTDLVSLTFVLTGFSSGIFLAASNNRYLLPELDVYKTPLVIVLLATASVGAAVMMLPQSRYKWMLERIHSIPWLAWLILYVQAMPGANTIVVALLVLAVMLKDVIPWRQMTLPNEDILGHRVIMIASTLELTLLIFLSALLTVMEGSTGISNASIVTVREAAFLFFVIISAIFYYEVATIIMTINGLMQELSEMEDETEGKSPVAAAWNRRLARYLKPFILTRKGIQIRLNAQTDQIETLSSQLEGEKKRNAQLTLLLELSQQFENQLDQPVAAQLAVHTLERALDCSLASIYTYEPDTKEFMLLAAAGPKTDLIPSGYRQDASAGAIGRASRQRKTQIVNDIRQDKDYLLWDNEKHLSAVIIPLIFNGHINGVIMVNSEKVNAFSSIDIGLAEAVAAELSRAWERSGYHQRLTDLIQAGSHLSSMIEPVTTAQETASIAKDILQARFTFIHIQLGQERNLVKSASAGNAPQLLEYLKDPEHSESLLRIAYQAVQPFRIRDIRKYSVTSHIVIDNPALRSMLTVPIRWHRMNIGAIFAFGKQNEVFFTENDESLAELLAIQAAGAFESTWLQQELRASLRITSLLYRLGNQIIQAENLGSAAVDIAQTAYKLAKSIATGIVLMDGNENIAAEVRVDATGISSGTSHPMELIKDAMNSGQLIYFSQGQSAIRICLPIQTPIRKYGAIWLDIPEDQGMNSATNPNDLQALVNQAAIALERSLLLVESRRQAVEIKAAYDTLENTYDQTLASLISALDARDRETEGHSLRVSRLAIQLGKTLGFTQEQLKVLERGSILHDIGKIGVSDNILHKPGPLNEEEWKIMKKHPDIGAKIVEGIPFLEETIPLIRHHQERWDGTGYPDRLKGDRIPLLARLFAVVDAYDALTSNRPYRQSISAEEAVQYIVDNAGILFDPAIVNAFEKMIAEDKTAFIHPE